MWISASLLGGGGGGGGGGALWAHENEEAQEDCMDGSESASGGVTTRGVYIEVQSTCCCAQLLPRRGH